MKKLLRVLTYSKDVSDLIEYKDIRDGDLLNRRMFLKVIEDFLTRRLKLKNGLILTTDFNEEGELLVEVGLMDASGGGGSIDLGWLKQQIEKYLNDGIRKEWEEKSKELNELADRLGRIQIPKYPTKKYGFEKECFDPPKEEVEFHFQKEKLEPISFNLKDDNNKRHTYIASESEIGKKSNRLWFDIARKFGRFRQQVTETVTLIYTLDFQEIRIGVRDISEKVAKEGEFADKEGYIAEASLNTLTSASSAFYWEKIKEEDLPLYFTDSLLNDSKFSKDYAHVRMGRDSYSLLYGNEGHGVYAFGCSFTKKVGGTEVDNRLNKGVDPAHSTASIVGKEVAAQKLVLADGSVLEKGEDWRGPRGPQGEKGDRGADGDTNIYRAYGGLKTDFDYIHCNAPNRDNDHDGGLIYFTKAIGNFHTSDYHENVFNQSSLNCSYFYINGNLRYSLKEVGEALGLCTVERKETIPDKEVEKKDPITKEIKMCKSLDTGEWVVKDNYFTALKEQVQAQLSDPSLQFEQEIEQYEETIEKEKQEEVKQQWAQIQALSAQALQEKPEEEKEKPEETKEEDLQKKLEELVQQIKEMEQSSAASQKTMTMFMLFLIIFFLNTLFIKGMDYRD